MEGKLVAPGLVGEEGASRRGGKWARLWVCPEVA